MFLSELWGTFRRRWVLLLVLLLVSAGVWGIAAAKVAPSYKAAATFVLVPPKSVENPDTNRYLDLGSLTDSVDVLARSMGSLETTRALEAKAPDASYAVTADETTSAPIVSVSVSAPDQDSAARMLDAVASRVPANLAELQRSIGIKTDFQITAMILTRDATPAIDQSTRYRVLGALAVGLLLLVALVIAAVDGVLVGRPAPERAPDPARHTEPEPPGVPAPVLATMHPLPPPPSPVPEGPARPTSPSVRVPVQVAVAAAQSSARRPPPTAPPSRPPAASNGHAGRSNGQRVAPAPEPDPEPGSDPAPRSKAAPRPGPKPGSSPGRGPSAKPAPRGRKRPGDAGSGNTGTSSNGNGRGSANS